MTIPAPMEAKLVDALPEGEGWQYEPKWDGFRAIVAREGDDVAIVSKAGKPLARFFPELVEMIAAVGERRFMLDGELMLPIGDALSFDALQARLHPAASRIARLSIETPAQLMLFDCLGIGDASLIGEPLEARREALVRFHRAHRRSGLLLSPASTAIADARDWLARSGGALDGVVAKRIDEPYRSGERAMLKVKQHRTADCVVGGFRRAGDGSGGVASLLLGLYGEDGLLHHVGFTSGIAAKERMALAKRLAPMVGEGFTGKAPGGPSRWNRGEESAWEPLRPELVVEVVYDQVTGARFRHGTRLLRWRPDKPARQCTMDQMVTERTPMQLDLLDG